jgi:hypothetical protein
MKRILTILALAVSLTLLSGCAASKKKPNKPMTISEAIAACRAIQGERKIPVACETDYINGQPAMLMAFPDLGYADMYLEAMVEHVAAPFCASANSVNRPAFLVFLIKSTNMANAYSCESGTLSGWRQFK